MVSCPSPFTAPTQADCSPFASPTATSLVFFRKTTTQNSAGELLLSFASALTVSLDLQPRPGNYVRLIQGAFVAVHYTGFVANGVPDVRVSDRATIADVTGGTSGAHVEVVSVQRWGSLQSEIDLAWVR